jgi:hypothetical protein
LIRDVTAKERRKLKAFVPSKDYQAIECRLEEELKGWEYLHSSSAKRGGPSQVGDDSAFSMSIRLIEDGNNGS